MELSDKTCFCFLACWGADGLQGSPQSCTMTASLFFSPQGTLVIGTSGRTLLLTGATMKMLSALSWMWRCHRRQAASAPHLNPFCPSQILPSSSPSIDIFFKSYIGDLGHIFSKKHKSYFDFADSCVSQHRAELIYFNLNICLYNLLEIFYKEK